MTDLLKDRVAIVTGGSRGLGSVAAKALAAQGAHVAVVGRTLAPLQAVAAEIEALGRPSLAISADVTKEDQVIAMVERVVGKFGKIDILVNCAGIVAEFKPLVETSLDFWQRTLDANLTSTMLCGRECLKRMIPQRSGNIINIVGTSAKRGIPFMAPHSASKYGVIGLTQAMASEVASFGIRVNSICPGGIKGEHHAILQDRVQERMQEKAGAAAMGTASRSGSAGQTVTPEEISRLIVFLASDLSDPITGQSPVISRGGEMC